MSVEVAASQPNSPSRVSLPANAGTDVVSLGRCEARRHQRIPGTVCHDARPNRPGTLGEDADEQRETRDRDGERRQAADAAIPAEEDQWDVIQPPNHTDKRGRSQKVESTADERPQEPTPADLFTERRHRCRRDRQWGQLQRIDQHTRVFGRRTRPRHRPGRRQARRRSGSDRRESTSSGDPTRSLQGRRTERGAHRRSVRTSRTRRSPGSGRRRPTARTLRAAAAYTTITPTAKNTTRRRSRAGSSRPESTGGRSALATLIAEKIVSVPALERFEPGSASWRRP